MTLLLIMEKKNKLVQKQKFDFSRLSEKEDRSTLDRQNAIKQSLPSADMVEMKTRSSAKTLSYSYNQGNLNALHKIKKSLLNIRDMNRSELEQLTKDQLIDIHQAAH